MVLEAVDLLDVVAGGIERRIGVLVAFIRLGPIDQLRVGRFGLQLLDNLRLKPIVRPTIPLNGVLYRLATA